MYPRYVCLCTKDDASDTIFFGVGALLGKCRAAMHEVLLSYVHSTLFELDSLHWVGRYLLIGNEVLLSSLDIVMMCH